MVLKFDQEIFYEDCEKEGERMYPRGRPFFIVLEGPLEPFTRTLTAQFISKKDNHSVGRRGRQFSTFS